MAENVHWFIPETECPKLFEAVQWMEIYADSKYFVDCIPRISIEQINQAFEEQQDALQNPDALREFVKEYFILADEGLEHHEFTSDVTTSLRLHIQKLWKLLKRIPKLGLLPSSLMPLPEGYIVPGGRFREIYYWDSYFTMLGLVRDGQQNTAINMLHNFAYMINELGFIPNGNRSYFRSRSQAPFFGSMIALVNENVHEDLWQKFGPALRKEYDFWMQGASELSDSNRSHRRVVRYEGTILNRFWDDSDQPRPESYKEDVKLAKKTNKEHGALFRDVRAACESGWDFSSRWFKNQTDSLADIVTTQILPVDLNVLLGLNEQYLANYYASVGDQVQADLFMQASKKRFNAINELFWCNESSWFKDLNWTTSSQTDSIHMGGAFPLFAQIVSAERASSALESMKNNLLADGGMLTTTQFTDQQWDAPNGWAPHQWIGFKAAQNYQDFNLARTIANRWTALNEQVFKRSGKMMEKYNVADLSLDAGGGEYPLQDGFGWTNGVYVALKEELSQL